MSHGCSTRLAHGCSMRLAHGLHVQALYIQKAAVNSTHIHGDHESSVHLGGPGVGLCCSGSSQTWLPPCISEIGFPLFSTTKFPACISCCPPPESSWKPSCRGAISSKIVLDESVCDSFLLSSGEVCRAFLRFLQTRAKLSKPPRIAPHPAPIPIPAFAPVLNPEDAGAS